MQPRFQAGKRKAASYQVVPRSIAPRVHARFPCSGSARSQHSGRSGRHTSCSAARQNPGHHCGAAGDPTAQAIGGRAHSLGGPFWTLASCMPRAKGFSRPVLSLLQRHRGNICGGKRFRAGGLNSGSPRLQYLGAMFCDVCSCADC